MHQSQIDDGRQAPTVGSPIPLSRSGKESGFTLVELLVVVAIIGILATLLIPALNQSKARAQEITCMKNKQQLTLAWTMYSGDNEEKLAYNLASDPSVTGWSAKSNPNWVNNVMDWELSPDNTNTSFANTSLLGSYISGSAQLFRCPSDRALSPVQKRAGWNSTSGGRVRSISMNAMVGNPGSAFQWGVNTNNPNYVQFLRESDIPSPSSIFVFLDEHPDSIDDGYFLVKDGGQWVNLPGSYHNGGGSFSFADGHTVIHHWVDASTVRPPYPDASGLPIALRNNQTADYQWMLRHSSVDKNPSQDRN